jgi:ribosomal protein L37AE/L43A
MEEQFNECTDCGCERLEHLEPGLKECKDCGSVFDTESGKKLEVRNG